MSKYQTIKARIEPEKIKKDALRALVETLNAPSIDLSKCGDPSYFATLNKWQVNRIKKITLSKGVISAVEFTPIESTATAAASIAGIQVTNQAKAQAHKEAAKKETQNTLKGGELRITMSTAEEKKKTEDEETAESFSQNIERLSNGEE